MIIPPLLNICCSHRMFCLHDFHILKYINDQVYEPAMENSDSNTWLILRVLTKTNLDSSLPRPKICLVVITRETDTPKVLEVRNKIYLPLHSKPRIPKKALSKLNINFNYCTIYCFLLRAEVIALKLLKSHLDMNKIFAHIG